MSDAPKSGRRVDISSANPGSKKSRTWIKRTAIVIGVLIAGAAGLASWAWYDFTHGDWLLEVLDEVGMVDAEKMESDFEQWVECEEAKRRNEIASEECNNPEPLPWKVVEEE